MITWRDHVNLSRYNILPLQSPHNLDDVPIVMVLVLAGFDAILGAVITSSTIIAAALGSWSFQRSYQGFWISPPFGCLVLMSVLGSGWLPVGLFPRWCCRSGNVYSTCLVVEANYGEVCFAMKSQLTQI